MASNPFPHTRMPKKGKKNTKKAPAGASGTKKRPGRPPNVTQPPPAKLQELHPRSQPENPAAPQPASAPATCLPPDDHLMELIEQEKQSMERLEGIEKVIYDYEAKYLTASVAGNVVRGYVNMLGNAEPSAMVIRDEDRIFSRSSVTGAKHLDGVRLITGLTET